MYALILVLALVAPVAFAGPGAAKTTNTMKTETSTMDTRSAATTTTTAEPHVFVMSKDLKWVAAPAGLPKGAQLAVIDGDPSKAAEFTVRLKFPANYKIMPHTHPTAEKVTIMQGTMALGMGDKFDEKTAQIFQVGDFAKLPAGMRHYAMAKSEAIIQLHGMGPFEINYVNPSDDPRNQTMNTRSTTTMPVEDSDMSSTSSAPATAPAPAAPAPESSGAQ